MAPALRAVMAGRSVLEGEVLERAVALGAGAPVAEKPDLTAIFPQLTDRERDVVALIAEGLDNRRSRPPPTWARVPFATTSARSLPSSI